MTGHEILMGAVWGAMFAAAWFTASAAAALVIGRWMSGPRTPVPGIAPETRTTPSSAPAPGPPRPGHGGALVSIHFYPGGVTRLDDHQRERSFLIEPPADEEADAAFLTRLEAELREP
jgi:hypothetical protein